MYGKARYSRPFRTFRQGGYPDEPLNAGEIRVKIRKGGGTVPVSCRYRVTEVHIPPSDEVLDWS
jgi:hypothetical protein